MQDLARKLFAIEAKQSGLSESSVAMTAHVSEKLRMALLQFAGAVGFSSLLSRALTLTCIDMPDLKSLRVRADGTLEGFADIEEVLGSLSISSPSHPGVALVSQLLSLLITFIGVTIVVSLLQDAWPNESFGLAEQKGEEKK